MTEPNLVEALGKGLRVMGYLCMSFTIIYLYVHMELWSVVGRKVKGILRRKNINEQSSFCPISTSVFAGLSPALGPGGRHQLQLLTATFLTTTHALMSTTLWLQTHFNRCGRYIQQKPLLLWCGCMLMIWWGLLKTWAQSIILFFSGSPCRFWNFIYFVSRM